MNSKKDSPDPRAPGLELGPLELDWGRVRRGSSFKFSERTSHRTVFRKQKPVIDGSD
jgi:hypothetical protein